MQNLQLAQRQYQDKEPLFRQQSVENKQQPQTLHTHQLEQNVDKIQERTWQEFYDGMDMLHKHINKINVDATQIIRSNLRLLHSNLLSSAQYKKHIKTLKTENNLDALISRYPIISTTTIQGSFLRINKLSKDAKEAQLATHICYDYFNSSDTFHSVEPLISMYFLIEGKLSIDYSNKLNAVSCGTQNNASVSTRFIKSGDVIINPQYHSDLLNINNLSRDTLLLAVHIAHTQD